MKHTITIRLPWRLRLKAWLLIAGAFINSLLIATWRDDA